MIKLSGSNILKELATIPRSIKTTIITRDKYLAELGKKIHELAYRWLLKQGYKPLEEKELIENYITYFAVKDLKEVSLDLKKIMFETIASEFIATNDIIDAIAHEVHEIVEVTELVRKFGKIEKSTLEIEPEKYEYAHRIAKKWEEKFLKENRKKRNEKINFVTKKVGDGLPETIPEGRKVPLKKRFE
ncbi:MAG: hypothetical protein B6U95_00050 [Thermofilum sp. ex4484_82]|nr:MAG: hypothetical protein B6U95_00050 [Thermofilum sp. ex4484_82]OYT40121.1 MAG: hypothetical protein B6U96_00050 [Archaeoglobales archaeon ex4484_92]